MVPLLIIVLALVSVGVGYWLTHRVPDEIPAATKPVIIAYALLTLLLFGFFPWWQAALLIGALLIGWLFGVFALAVLVTDSSHSLGLLYVTLSLALLFGARWRFEEHNRWTLAFGSVAFTVLLIGIRILQA